MILEGENDEGDEQLETEIREHVAKRIGKLARPKRIIWTADVPKTRSGKIMRRLLRDIAEGRELGDVTTLREPGVMQDLAGKVGSGRDAGTTRGALGRLWSRRRYVRRRVSGSVCGPARQPSLP